MSEITFTWSVEQNYCVDRGRHFLGTLDCEYDGWIFNPNGRWIKPDEVRAILSKLDELNQASEQEGEA